MATEPDTSAELRSFDALMSAVDLVALNAQAVRTSIDLVDHATSGSEQADAVRGLDAARTADPHDRPALRIRRGFPWRR